MAPCLQALQPVDTQEPSPGTSSSCPAVEDEVLPSASQFPKAACSHCIRCLKCYHGAEVLLKLGP